MAFLERFRAKSIRYLLKMAFVTIICCFLVTFLISLIFMRQMTREYGSNIDNIEFANSLSRVAKEKIAPQCWYIVAGRQSFEDSDIYQEIDALQRDLRVLYSNTSTDSGQGLVEASIRATATLSGYVDRLREQCDTNTPVSYRQMTLSEIYKVSDSIFDALQEFTYTQTTGIAQANDEMQRTSIVIMGLLAILSAVVILIAMAAYRMLLEALDRPNREISAMADRILQGDLTPQTTAPEMEELQKLTDGINLMAQRIRTLLDKSIQEQQELQKSELRALQAQITPHFLYNTFDTIVWLAECGHNQEVVDITIAFSSYYRIALSRGRDFITVREEMEHVRDYLIIQQVRYQDILRYHIDVDPAMEDRRMLKLLLQPLVENALYHGIKSRRHGGSIQVGGKLLPDGSLHFWVEDDGMGMTEEALERLHREITADHLPETSGYGLYNVNRRIRLYYGAADLAITSQYGEGTRIAFTLPPKEDKS